MELTSLLNHDDQFQGLAAALSDLPEEACSLAISLYSSLSLTESRWV